MPITPLQRLEADYQEAHRLFGPVARGTTYGNALIAAVCQESQVRQMPPASAWLNRYFYKPKIVATPSLDSYACGFNELQPRP